MDLVTLKEATEIMTERGVSIDSRWLRRKAASGAIPGARLLTPRLWLVPRKWAETYVKIKGGRPRRDGR